MIDRYTYKKLTWLDVIHPTAEDIRMLFDECGLPTDFSGDLTSMTPRSETRCYKGVLKITLDWPLVKRTDITHPHEVKFIATKTHLITIRFEDITAIHSFAKEFEVLSLLPKSVKNATGAHMLLNLLRHMYTNLDEKLDYLGSEIQRVEENIFNDNEKEMLFEISAISRRLISFRHTLATHEGALMDLRTGIAEAFGKEHVATVSKMNVSYAYLLQRVAALSNTLDELRDTNSALLSTKQNEVMKILTIMAFITFPLSLFTSMFGMNTVTTPIVGHEYDFWVILSIMAVVSVGFFAFFKYKKWM